MKKLSVLLLLFMNIIAWAGICPDPNNSSLKWGEIPAPWALSPFSDITPPGVINTHFVRANILVAGYGQGVACTYRNSAGYYSIWWQINTKIPAPIENNWRNCLGGYECNTSLTECMFYTA